VVRFGNSFFRGDADWLVPSKKIRNTNLCYLPLDAYFANVQKGRRKMFIRPNHSIEYRNWAYCCSEIHSCQFLLDYYSAGKTPNPSGHFILKSSGRTGLLEHCLKKARMLSRKIARYAQLRDKFAAGLDAPDSHLLQVEDMLDMVGNVIEITPRHSRKKQFTTLAGCSSDGTFLKTQDGEKFDAYKLLSFGYGK
jgi:hypothetical protein